MLFTPSGSIRVRCVKRSTSLDVNRIEFPSLNIRIPILHAYARNVTAAGKEAPYGSMLLIIDTVGPLFKPPYVIGSTFGWSSSKSQAECVEAAYVHP